MLFQTKACSLQLHAGFKSQRSTSLRTSKPQLSKFSGLKLLKSFSLLHTVLSGDGFCVVSIDLFPNGVEPAHVHDPTVPQTSRSQSAPTSHVCKAASKPRPAESSYTVQLSYCPSFSLRHPSSPQSPVPLACRAPHTHYPCYKKNTNLRECWPWS